MTGNIKKLCAVGLGVLVSALLFKLIQQKQQCKKNEEKQLEAKQQQDKNKQQLKNMEILRQQLLRKRKYFEIEYQSSSQQYLTKDCIFKIIQNSADLINQKQFQVLYAQNRRARRTVFSQIQTKYETYFRFVCTLDENIKYLIERTEKDFVAFIDLDFNKFVESIEYHIEQDQSQHSPAFRQSLIQLTSSIRDQLNNSLPLYNSPVDKQKLQQILNFQLQLLTQETDKILELVDKIGLVNRDEQQAIPLFLNFYLADSIYEKFQIQSEQMTMDDSEKNEQSIQKYGQINELKNNLIRKMHQIIQQGFAILDQEQESK